MEYLLAIADRFRRAAPSADYWSLHLVSEKTDELAVRQGVTEPSVLGTSLGAFLTLVRGAGIGYGATSDLSPAGLAAAWERAASWADSHARLGLFDAGLFPRSSLRAEYASPVAEPWESVSLGDKLDLLR
ncbi:MAG: DNA gyrase modulator, partial [Chromatiaceae bacterium]